MFRLSVVAMGLRRTTALLSDSIRSTHTAGTTTAAAEPSLDEDYDRIVRYCADKAAAMPHRRAPFLPLEEVMLNAGVSDVDVVDHIMSRKATDLELRVALRVRPKRVPRAAIVLVDGDDLPAAAVNDMCEELRLIKEQCSVFIFRHPENAPLSPVDTLTPEGVSTSLSIEKKAREIRLRCPVVLRDVVYMCSARQFRTYATHVARVNAFPDADVYVCCPSKVELVEPKTLVPY